MVDNEDPAASGRTRTYSTDLLVSSPPGDLRDRLRRGALAEAVRELPTAARIVAAATDPGG